MSVVGDRLGRLVAVLGILLAVVAAACGERVVGDGEVVPALGASETTTVEESERDSDTSVARAVTRPTGEATSTTALTVYRVKATLDGQSEVPGPGSEGTGSASLTVNTQSGDVCFDVRLSEVTGATAAQLHEGAAGQAGPVVVPFGTPSETGTRGCAKADPALAQRISANAQNFYVNVLSSEFPNGAVRGQLGGTRAEQSASTTVADRSRTPGTRAGSGSQGGTEGEGAGASGGGAGG